MLTQAWIMFFKKILEKVCLLGIFVSPFPSFIEGHFRTRWGERGGGYLFTQSQQQNDDSPERVKIVIYHVSLNGAYL